MPSDEIEPKESSSREMTIDEFDYLHEPLTHQLKRLWNEPGRGEKPTGKYIRFPADERYGNWAMKPSDAALDFLVKYGGDKNAGRISSRADFDFANEHEDTKARLMILMLRALAKANVAANLEISSEVKPPCAVYWGSGQDEAQECVEADTEFDACLKAVEAAAAQPNPF